MAQNNRVGGGREETGAARTWGCVGERSEQVTGPSRQVTALVLAYAPTTLVVSANQRCVRPLCQQAPSLTAPASPRAALPKAQRHERITAIGFEAASPRDARRLETISMCTPAVDGLQLIAELTIHISNPTTG